MNPAAAFCQSCGTRLTVPQAPFSGEIQEQLMPRELARRVEEAMRTSERRQVTVLFADVVGFTALSESLDPEDVREIMGAMFVALAGVLYRHGAYIEKFIGDAIVAIFGAPVAHEDDAVRACLAALGMQEVLQRQNEELGDRLDRRLSLRIGVNTGLAITGPVGDGSQYGATGDTVNVAARLEQNAPVGSVLVSESTMRLARDVFHFRPVEPLSLKGKEQPFAAFELLAPAHRVASAARSCVGREPELEELGGVLRQSIERRRAQVVSIVGEPGVGKTSVLRELLARLDPEVQIYRAACRADVQGAYAIIGDVLSAIFLLPDADSEQRRKALHRALAELDLEPLEPILGNVMGLPYEDHRLQSQSLLVVTRRAVRDLLDRLTAQAPVLLAIEDLHWADQDSLGLLGYVLDQLEEAPLVMVATDRREMALSLPGAAGISYRQVALGPLGRSEALQVAGAIMGTPELPATMTELIVDRAEGIPLFLEEMVEWLVDNGSLVRSNSHWELAPDAQLDVPGSIQALITARLDALDAQTRRALQVASVIGREFDLELLEAVSGASAVTPLLAAESARLVEEVSLPRSRSTRFQFHHALVQETAYNLLLKRARRDLHEKVATVLEEREPEAYDVLAYHYGKAENLQNAFQYAGKAARQAARAFALAEAIAQFDAAIELAEKYPDLASPLTLVDLYGDRGNVRLGRSDLDEAVKDFRRMLELAQAIGSREAEGRAHARLATIYWHAHEMELSMQHAEAASAIAAGSSDPELIKVLADALVDIASVQGHLGETEDARRNLEEGLRLSRSVDHHVGAANSLAYLALIDEWQGNFAECVQRAPGAIDAADAAHEPFGLLFNRWILGLGLCGQGRYDESARILEDVRSRSREMGNSFNQARSLNTLAWVHQDLYDPARAVELSQTALEIARSYKFYEPEANALLNLAEAYVSLDALETAEKTILETGQLYGKDPWMQWRWQTRLLYLLGEIRLRQGRNEEGLEAARDSLQQAEGRSSRKHMVRALLIEGRCLAAIDEADLAIAALQRSVALADEINNPPSRWQTRYWLSRILERTRAEEWTPYMQEATSIVQATAASLQDPALLAPFLASGPVAQIRG